jgi:hypothetical protein
VPFSWTKYFKSACIAKNCVIYKGADINGTKIF